jgi:hypothetical protein
MEYVPMRLREPPDPSWPRVDASDRARPCPLRGVEVDDDAREYAGEVCD